MNIQFTETTLASIKLERPIRFLVKQKFKEGCISYSAVSKVSLEKMNEEIDKILENQEQRIKYGNVSNSNQD